jgi:hypothetical protein
VLVRWRRSHPPRRSISVRLPADRSLVRDGLAIFATVFVAVIVLIVVPVPGTTQRTSISAVLFFSPLLATVALGAGSRRLVGFSRLGPLALTWLGAIGASAVLAIVTSNPVIIPARHAEYGIIPVMLLVAVGAGRLVARSGDAYGRKAAVAGGVALLVLVAANAAIVYPPPRDFGGFQEGLTASDAGVWMWVGIGIPSSAVVASDHRLSSMIFGFDGNRATWDSTRSLFTGHTFGAAVSELRSSYAPHTMLPIWAVAVDATMYDGVALDPNASAAPLSTEAQVWFTQPPFVPLYENGLQAVYWVDASTFPP